MSRLRKLEPGRKPNETAIEYLRRLVHNCDMEPESILQDLPSVEALLEFFGLWHVYDTDFIDGVISCIEDGDDPAPYLAFVKKWGLKWETKFNVRKVEA